MLNTSLSGVKYVFNVKFAYYVHYALLFITKIKIRISDTHVMMKFDAESKLSVTSKFKCLTRAPVAVPTLQDPSSAFSNAGINLLQLTT